MKEIIYQFSKHNARNAQHVQFATDVLNAVPEETATAQGFASQRAVLATAAADELDCFQPDKAYLGTPEIESTDRRRDTVFLFYKAIANAYADYCPDADKQQAGATVAFAFREAGKASELDYASETAVLSDLVGKLGEDPYAAALAEIGLSDAPTVIAEANDAFNAVYLKRSAEERDRKLGATMKTLRPVTDDAFNELAKAINALYAANELVTKDAEKFGEILLQEDFYPPIFVSRNLNRYDYESEKIFHGNDACPLPGGSSRGFRFGRHPGECPFPDRPHGVRTELDTDPIQ